MPDTPIQKGPGLLSLLGPYKLLIGILVVLTLISNALTLVVPKIIAKAIDDFITLQAISNVLLAEFALVAVGIFIFTYLQNITQTYASERVARDLRTRVTAKIATLQNATIEHITPAKLLTNLTSDIDAVKTFVSQAISTLISSFFLIIGSAVFLFLINWQLALAVLTIVPIIGITFSYVLGRVRKLFKKAQEAIDWLNKVISESVLGAGLIRLLDSNAIEHEKFRVANAEARDIGFGILRLFAILIPVITFTVSLAMIIILSLGGHYIITGSMTLGDFSAFNSYLGILIFPIILIGFMSNVIAQASASFARVGEVLASPDKKSEGTIDAKLAGKVEAKNITLKFGERVALNNISFTVAPNSKVAIIGPTAAGKTQLLYAMVGLIVTDSGEVRYDDKLLYEYDAKSFYSQVGFVFQDSILFNLSVRENIAFSKTVTNQDLQKAIETAQLDDFVNNLPEGLDTVVSERGNSLSGGQKQRIMLARALALNPRVLLLDDFTARVDGATEQAILKNIQKNYPSITLISVTQKISSIEHYDQIIVLMEGEIVARGTHTELLETSPEYVQILESQKSTNKYEVRT
jgi:ATP-binding cassette subfamily B protein